MKVDRPGRFIRTKKNGFSRFRCLSSALRSSYLHPLQLSAHCDLRYLFNSFLTIDKTKIGTQPYRLFNPSNDDESPLPDYDHCSSSGNRLLRTFRAKFLHVRQLIAVKLEQNGRRWSHYGNFSRSWWPRGAMPKVISRLSRRVSVILMYWFDRCVYSSENMPNLVPFIQLE